MCRRTVQHVENVGVALSQFLEDVFHVFASPGTVRTFLELTTLVMDYIYCV